MYRWLEYEFGKRQNSESNCLSTYTKYSNVDKTIYKNWVDYEDDQEWTVYNSGKHLRIVFFKNHLTDMLSNNENSIYHPFYPETFYHSFELIEQLKGKLGLFESNSAKIMVISGDEALGTLESILLHSDIGKVKPNIYHLYTNVTDTPNILVDTYHFTEVDKISKIKSVDLYIIDVLSKTEENTWMLEEHDFHFSIHWLIATIQQLAPHKTLIIRMRHMCHLNWIIISQIIKHYFREMKHYHPKICEVSDATYYLLGIDKNEQMIDDQTLELKKYYDMEWWRTYYLKVKYSENELMEYRKIEKKWLDQTSKIDYIQWLKKMGLFVQLKSNGNNNVGNVPSASTLKYINYIFRNVNHNDIILKLGHWNGVYSMSASNLQLVKRWMDSKPIVPLISRSDEVFRDNLIELHKLKLTTSAKWFKDILFENNSELLCWNYIVKKTNPFRYLPKILGEQFGAQIVTNAWMKFFEILTINPRLTRKFPDTIWKSCHICEAPGAFISALNHYLRQEGNTITKWQWSAQSLWSETPKILGDEYGLMKSYPNNWIFEDNGDITNPDIIRAYLKRKVMTNPHLITADGAIPLDNNQFGMEEILMMKLFLGEIIMTLGLLSTDGCAVIKMFLPFKESLTLTLFYILKQHFDRISIQKPVTSRCHNSEVYLILEGYHPISPDQLELLISLLDEKDIHRISLVDINTTEFKSFIKDIDEIRDNIIEHQISGLINLYHYFLHPSDNSVYHHKLWMEKCKPTYLKSEYQL